MAFKSIPFSDKLPKREITEYQFYRSNKLNREKEFRSKRALVQRVRFVKPTRFNKKNFASTRAHAGLYLRTLIASLSIKGNWPVMFKELVKYSVIMRTKLMRSFSSLRTFAHLKRQFSSIAAKPVKLEINRQLAKRLQIKKSRLARLVLNFKGLVLKKRRKARLTRGQLLSIIQQIELGRKDFGLRAFNLRLRFRRNAKNKLTFRLSNWRAFHQLLGPLSLYVELKTKKRGARVFTIPIPIKRVERRRKLFIHWMKDAIREPEKRNNLNLSKRILRQVEELSQKKGAAMRRLFALKKSIQLGRVFIRKSRIRLA